MLELTESGPIPLVRGMLLTVFLIIAGACGSSEYNTSLGGGYKLVKVHGSGIVVYREEMLHNFFLQGVTDLRQKDNFLIGRVNKRPSHLINAYQPGYFIINIQTHERQIGLSQAEWKQALVKSGLPGDIDIDGIPWRYDTSPIAQLVRILALFGALSIGGIIIFGRIMKRVQRR